MYKLHDRNGNLISLTDDLNGVDFDSVDLSHADFNGKILEGAIFSDANLSYANLQGCDLYWANFYRASLIGADLRNTCLCGANLTLADLSGADLRHANLGIDNLGGSTQLQGADLTNCVVDGASFKGAEYDSSTKFPLGFNASLLGMKLL